MRVLYWRAAAGLSAAQVCSARWQGALIDAELLGEIQARCGSGAGLSSVAPQINNAQPGAAQVVAAPVEAVKQAPAPVSAATALKPAAQPAAKVFAKTPEPSKANEKPAAVAGTEAGKIKGKNDVTAADPAKAKHKVAQPADAEPAKTKKKTTLQEKPKAKSDAQAKTPEQQ